MNERKKKKYMINTSVAQIYLFNAMDSIYMKYPDRYPFSADRVRMIKESIRSGTYQFSSFVVRDEPPKGVESLVTFPCPFPSLPSSYQLVVANSEDELVLMAMSNFSRLSVLMPIPRYIGDALCLCEQYYCSTGSLSSLVGWGDIFNLIRIDFRKSLISLDSNVVLDFLRSVIFDSQLIDLYTDFLFSSTVVDNEKNPIEGFEGILPAGYISYVLLNLVLCFWERKFKLENPTIKYFRFMHYAFIGLPYISNVSDSTLELREHFSEMRLNGSIQVFSPGDAPFLYNNVFVYLRKDYQIQCAAASEFGLGRREGLSMLRLRNLFNTLRIASSRS